MNLQDLLNKIKKDSEDFSMSTDTLLARLTGEIKKLSDDLDAALLETPETN